MATLKLELQNVLTLSGTSYGQTASRNVELNEAAEATVPLTTTFKVIYDDATFGGIGALRICFLVNTGAEIIYGRLLNRTATQYMPFAIPVGGHFLCPLMIANETDSTHSFVSQVACATGTATGSCHVLLGWA